MGHCHAALCGISARSALRHQIWSPGRTACIARRLTLRDNSVLSIAAAGGHLKSIMWLVDLLRHNGGMGSVVVAASKPQDHDDCCVLNAAAHSGSLETLCGMYERGFVWNTTTMSSTGGRRV